MQKIDYIIKQEDSKLKLNEFWQNKYTIADQIHAAISLLSHAENCLWLVHFISYSCGKSRIPNSFRRWQFPAYHLYKKNWPICRKKVVCCYYQITYCYVVLNRIRHPQSDRQIYTCLIHDHLQILGFHVGAWPAMFLGTAVTWYLCGFCRILVNVSLRWYFVWSVNWQFHFELFIRLWDGLFHYSFSNC